MEQIFENDDLVIIDKPAGISIHNDPESIEKKYPDLFITHRLDKETSGCLVLAKSKPMVAKIMQLFENNQIEKTYRAIVFGKHSEKKISSPWKQSLSKRPGGLNNIKGLKPMVNAETIAKLATDNDYFTELLIIPKTGRTHQLRKHCALNTAPIVGDTRYAKKQTNLRISKIYATDRMFLHAEKIAFEWDKKRVEAIAPTPSEFQKLMI